MCSTQLRSSFLAAVEAYGLTDLDKPLPLVAYEVDGQDTVISVADVCRLVRDSNDLMPESPWRTMLGDYGIEPAEWTFGAAARALLALIMRDKRDAYRPIASAGRTILTYDEEFEVDAPVKDALETIVAYAAGAHRQNERHHIHLRDFAKAYSKLEVAYSFDERKRAVETLLYLAFDVMHSPGMHPEDLRKRENAAWHEIMLDEYHDALEADETDPLAPDETNPLTPPDAESA